MAPRNGPGSGPAFGTRTKVWRVRAPLARAPLLRVAFGGFTRWAAGPLSVAAAGGGLDPLAQRLGELWRPRTLPGHDVRRGLDDLERRRVGRPASGARVDVGKASIPGRTIGEDVDPEGQRRRLVEARSSEADRRRIQRRVLAPRIARRPARDVDPDLTEPAGNARKGFRSRRWRRDGERAAADEHQSEE